MWILPSAEKSLSQLTPAEKEGMELEFASLENFPVPERAPGVKPIKCTGNVLHRQRPLDERFRHLRNIVFFNEDGAYLLDVRDKRTGNAYHVPEMLQLLRKAREL